MLNVLMKELHVQQPKEDKAITRKLEVGKWFRIDRDVIDKSKEEIRRKCNEAGDEGKELWERFEKSNKIADENPNKYSRLIETYIFKHDWEHKTEQEMRDMCREVGDGMCDEIICDLELQMRICNGESVNDLLKKADKLPYVRLIESSVIGMGYFGGSARYKYAPPASIRMYILSSFFYDDGLFSTPYAFRRVTSQH